MTRPIMINGHQVKTEEAKPPLSKSATPTVFYAILEGNDDVVGNGSSRHLAIESLRKQLQELTNDLPRQDAGAD